MTFKFDKIRGTLVYVQVQQAVKSFQKPGAPVKPDEYKAGVVVTDEDWMDEFEDELKRVDAKVSIAKVKAVEFENIYKCPVPEGAGKNVWVITLRKSVELGKTGKPVPDEFKPKVYEKIGSTLLDVTATKLPANGSKGIISVDVFERTNGSTSLYLKNVLVTEMIEYVRKSSDYKAGSEFDDELEDEAEDKPKAEKADKPKPKAKAKPVDDDEDEDLPF